MKKSLSFWWCLAWMGCWLFYLVWYMLNCATPNFLNFKHIILLISCMSPKMTGSMHVSHFNIHFYDECAYDWLNIEQSAYIYIYCIIYNIKSHSYLFGQMYLRRKLGSEEEQVPKQNILAIRNSRSESDHTYISAKQVVVE